MKWQIAAALLMVSGGCSPNPREDIARCQMEAYKHFSVGDMEDFAPPVKNFVSTCMESRGYKLNGARDGCPKAKDDPRTAWYDMEPECYDPPPFRLSS
jgi:hypothetical protein